MCVYRHASWAFRFSSVVKGAIISQAVNFKSRIILASLWTFGGHFLSQGIRLASNLIMTRLLVPDMFGLMAIVNVLLMGLVLLTDLGLRQNIIQSNRAEEDVFLNTVWTFQILRGLFIWVISIMVSIGIYFAQNFQWIASNTVYSEPLLPFIIPVATLAVVISAFEPTWTSLASRNLNQAKLVKIELISQVTGIFVMILIAFYIKTVWSLVAGALITSLMHAIIVNFLVAEKRNHFHIDKEALSEIFHFGKWIFLSSIVGFLINNGDRLLLGGLISSTELGVFSIAVFIVGAISMIVSRLLSNVAFPALSETARQKPEDLRRVYYRFRIPFDATALFLAGFFLLTGQTIIDFLYDSRYEDAGWILSLLGLSLVSLRYNLTDQCFLALGKPKLMTYLIMIRTSFMFVVLPIIFRYYGLYGAVWVIVLSYFSSFPLAIYYKKIHGLLDIKKELITFPVIFLGFLCGTIFNRLMNVFF